MSNLKRIQYLSPEIEGFLRFVEHRIFNQVLN